MSVLIMSKIFFTDFPKLKYKGERGHDGFISPPVVKLVMLAIADSCDDTGNNSWNGVERLCLKTNLSPRSISRATIALAQNGYLILMGTTNPGTNIYSIVLDKLSEIPIKKQSIRSKKERTVTVTPPSHSQDVPSHRRSRTVTVTPDSSISIINHPLQKDLQEEPLPPAKKNGDNMDKEQYLESLNTSLNKSLISHTSGYAHYPSRVIPIVERMEKLWHFVPPTRKSKQFGLWITSCDEIISGCAEFGIDLLDKLYNDWEAYLDTHGGCAPFTVSGPQSLVRSVLAKAAMLRSGNSVPLWKIYKEPVHQSRLDV